MGIDTVFQLSSPVWMACYYSVVTEGLMCTYVSMYVSLSKDKTLLGNSTSAVVEKLVTLEVENYRNRE